MENVSKALQIAGGVLLAVIILSLVVYGFKQFGILPQQEAENMTTEQLAKFNAEYEVYNKSQMYGVDVISCLNKVQNYNDKYVLTANDGQQTSGGFFVGTNKIGTEFRIDVEISIDSPLKEELRVYRIKEDTGRSVQVFNSGEVTENKTLEQLGLRFPSSADRIYRDYTLLEKDKSLADNFASHREGELDDASKFLINRGTGVYYKLSDESKASSGPLMSLLGFKDRDMKQTVTNDGKNAAHPVTEWSQVVWYTALNDFKTRHFKCVSIEKSNVTGQINLIRFEEVAGFRKDRN